jgi:hypothetical protein
VPFFYLICKLSLRTQVFAKLIRLDYKVFASTASDMLVSESVSLQLNRHYMKILMIKSLAKGAVVASLLCMGSAKAVSFSNVINLTEPADGASTWTWDSTLLGVTTSFRPEFASITGMTDAKLPGDEDGTHWGVLLETDGVTVSDILKLVVENGKTGQDPALVRLQIWSDGDPGFAAALAALPAGSPSMKETGALQDVGDKFLFNDNSGKLVIKVSSDLESEGVPPEGTPTPDGGTTMLLLGGGVSALAFLLRKLS